MVPGDVRTRAQSKPAFLPLDRPDGLAGEQIDFVSWIEGFRSEPQLVETALGGEVGFGEGRPLIRRHRLVTDQDDTAVKSLLAQRRGRLKAGLPGAEDGGDRIGHHTCVSGRWTTRPSNSGVTTSWQLSRLFGRRSLAVNSSIAFSSSDWFGVRLSCSSSTYTWQVAHIISPPHSATMPSTPLRIAARITLVPTGTSSTVRVPLECTYVIWGIVFLSVGY